MLGTANSFKIKKLFLYLAKPLVLRGLVKQSFTRKRKTLEKESFANAKEFPNIFLDYNKKLKNWW